MQEVTGEFIRWVVDLIRLIVRLRLEQYIPLRHKCNRLSSGVIGATDIRDSDKLILSLTTPDGFAVSFCITRQQLTELNDSIVHI